MESEKRVRLTLLEEFLKKMRRVNTVSAKRKGQGKAGRHPSLRCREVPLFLRGPGGRSTPPLETSLRRAGPLASPTFPRFVKHLRPTAPPRNTPTKATSPVTPRTGAGVSHMRLRSRLYVSELRATSSKEERSTEACFALATIGTSALCTHISVHSPASWNGKHRAKDTFRLRPRPPTCKTREAP